MALVDERGGRDLVIAQGSYIYIQSTNTGKIHTVVGPNKVTLDNQELAVTYEGRSQFKICDNPLAAIKRSVVVPEGYYCVLVNPSSIDDRPHPPEKDKTEPPTLNIGNKIVIEGPTMFALWPGQEAEVIRGHQLRSNEYLIGRVYNEEEARENASKARIVRANTEGDEATINAPELFDAKNLTVGQLIIIPGTQVSFYIPPTGISVLAVDGNLKKYVREAITLEQLEYCVLLDENGKKRFERGPKVVFPTATESFMVKDGKNKFRAIELNPIQGLHIKATAAYKDEVLGRDIKEGEEFFIKGDQFPIYFPREEHSIVKYDGKDKQFAISIPKGEGRYVLERQVGNIRMVTGPNMLLPNPVIEVPVRRVLSDQECMLWYPGNNEVLVFNRELRELSASSPTTRGGAVSEGEINRAARKGTRGVMASASLGNSLEMAAQSSMVSSAYGAGLSDEIERSSTYTTPRSLTLNTKLQGVPRIAIWPGYAIRVEDSSGQTRVEVGPKVVLLQYDEVLSVLSFSQGTPKTSDNPMRTPYLRIMNNKVTDQLTVETRDHAFIQLTLSYLVSFDPAMKDRWFNIDNYIKLMCDRTRAEITAAVRGIDVAKFHEDPMSILSRVVMNEEESRTFDENGMMITSFELRDFRFGDKTVADLLIGAQSRKLISNVAVINATTEKDRILSLETIKTEQATQVADERTTQTDQEKRIIALEKLLSDEHHAVEMARLTNEKVQTQEREAVSDVSNNAELVRRNQNWRAEETHIANMAALTERSMNAEAEAIVKRFEAISPGFIEAMMYLGQSDVAARIAEAGSIQRAIGADNLAELLQKVAKPFTNGEAGEVLASVAKKVLPNGGDSRVDRR